MGFEQLECPFLLDRQLRQFRGPKYRRQRLDHLHRPRSRLRLRSRWYHGVQHLTPAAEIIVGHPARQLHQLRRDHRFQIEHVLDRLDRPLRFLRDKADAKPGRRLVALAERDLHAHADCDAVGELLGNGVGVGMIERPIEDDFDERRPGCAGGFVGFEQVWLRRNRHRWPPLAWVHQPELIRRRYRNRLKRFRQPRRWTKSNCRRHRRMLAATQRGARTRRRRRTHPLRRIPSRLASQRGIPSAPMTCSFRVACRPRSALRRG